MMTRLYIGLTVAGICAVGFVHLMVLRRRLQGQTGRAAAFLQQLHAFLRSRAIGEENYSWLLRHCYEMQSDMGEFGIMGQFRPPYARYVVQNWPIVINSLPEMRQSLSQEFGSGREFEEYGALLQEAILRNVGALENQAKEMAGVLRNPLIWFRYGIQLLLLFPFVVLRSLGLSSVPEQGVLRNNSVFRLFATAAAIVAFFASVVTIVAGWDKVASFSKILLGYLHK